MSKLLVGLLVLVLTSCTIGKQGVFYNEMSKKPIIRIDENQVTLTTENSNRNSALLIYDIDYSINIKLKEIELRGFQAANKESKNTFEISIKEVTKNELNNYKFYWIDPDNKKTLVE